MVDIQPVYLCGGKGSKMRVVLCKIRKLTCNADNIQHTCFIAHKRLLCIAHHLKIHAGGYACIFVIILVRGQMYL